MEKRDQPFPVALLQIGDHLVLRPALTKFFQRHLCCLGFTAYESGYRFAASALRCFQLA
jgi:hypothetical protein